jgi:glyoxylase-like metal-dependent hydrolase (beta-lactamase superfamily II)
MAPQEVKDRLTAGEPLTILDVRRPDEVEAWPFPGSVHIPLQDLMLGQAVTVDPGREVVTLCAHGNRSKTAAEELRRRGITARSMEGGLAAWSQVYDLATISLGEVEVLQFRRLGKGCLSYLVAAGGAAAAIDPSWNTAQYVEAAAARGAVIRHVLDTHLHADHVSGARHLAEATGAELRVSPADPFQFGGFRPVADGDVIALGPARVTAIAAPGHTAGSVVWDLAGRALATGDILFLESVGRPDLHGQAEAFARELYRTVRRLLALPAHLLVLPGHLPESAAPGFGQPHADTLGTIKARLHLEADEAAFVARARRVPERPPNDRIILDVNRQGLALPPEDAARLEEGPNRCAVKAP